MKISKWKHTFQIAMIAGILLLIPTVLSAGDSSNTKYDHLIKALSTDNDYWRVEAANYLGEKKVSEAVVPLIEMLKNEKVIGCKMAAIVALGKIGDSKALAILKKCAESDNDRILRHVANANYQEIMNKVKLAEKSD